MLNKKAFTLIEALVVLAIVSLILSIFVISQSQIKKSAALLSSAHLLAQEIRKAREMSLGPTKIGRQYPRGYGIYVNQNPTQVVLFADLNGNNQYDFGEKIEDFSLKEGFISLSIFPSSPLNVVFLSPHPTVMINNNQNNTLAEIGLSFGSQTKKVKVLKSGLIYVE